MKVERLELRVESERNWTKMIYIPNIRDRLRKHLRQTARLICLATAALLLGSCSHREDDGPEADIQIPGMYFTLHLTVPTESSTRSTTTDKGESSDETLPGEANENAISRADVYFFDEEGGELLSFTATGPLTYPKLEGGSGNSYSVTAKVELEDLRQIIGKKVSLYVVANNQNTTPASGDTGEAEVADGTFTTTPVAFGTGKDGQLCPMSNQSKYEIDLEGIGNTGLSDGAFLATILEELFRDTYAENTKDEGHLWRISGSKNPEGETLGALQLERSVARIDYADKRTESHVKNVFELQGAKETVYLKVVSLQLFNLDQKAYTFRHTAPGTLSAATIASVGPFGIENGDATNQSYRWVADYNWGGSESKTLLNQMTAGDTDEDGNTAYTMTSDNVGYILATDLDTWLSANNKSTTDYAPWHYMMENTVSSVDDMDMTHCTGVQFRMVVCDAQGTPISKQAGEEDYRITMDADGYWQAPEWYSPKGKSTPGEGDLEEDEEEESTDETAGEPEGYYLTYRYLIDHNKSNNKAENKDYAPMGLGIVRNNVYQLSINGITGLPDPKKPDNNYLSIEIRVLAWAKRDISVTF